MSTPKPKICPVCKQPFDGRGTASPVPTRVIGIASTGGSAPLYPNIEACSVQCRGIADAKRPHREVHGAGAKFAPAGICSVSELTVVSR